MFLFEDVILPPGEKIKRIRGFLGLKQYEITGGKFTRNLVSYIENGKTKLIRETAEIIAHNINEMAKEKKVPLQIDADYLMKDEIDQAKDILNRYIQVLHNYSHNNHKEFESVFNKAIDILMQWDIPDQRAVVYEIAGDYYYSKEYFNKSYIEFFRSLESYLRIENYYKIALLYFKLGRAAIRLDNYQESLNLNNYSLLILEKHNIQDESLVNRITFNNALIYKKLGEYDKSLIELDKLIKALGENINHTQYVDISILKANCYYEQGKYLMAEKLYLKLLDNPCNIESKGIIHFNLGQIYEKYGKYQQSAKHIKESLDLRIKIESCYLLDSYIALGKSYYFLGDYNLSNVNLKEALRIAELQNKYSIILEIFKELLRQNIELDNEQDVNNLIKEVKNMAKKEVLKDDYIIGLIKDIVIEGSYYYIEKDIEQSKALLYFCLNIIK